MNDIFKDLIVQEKVTVYLDDILIFSEDIKEHRAVVRKVLKRLQQNDLYLKPEKCEFEQPRTEYLGLVISHNKLEMDPAKVKAIVDWPTPQNASDIRKFRGFANFYRRFIKDFSRICKPLDRLTGKEPWQWEKEQQDAFDMLKSCFAKHPILCMYNPDWETRIEVDTSNFATGGILVQKQNNNKWHPVAFLSESMTEPERNYKIYDKEMLAIIRALEAWRQYLEGLPKTFEIQSDHKNLEYWKTAQHLTRRQARWALYLSRFNFVISHKPGMSNGRADALSRRSDHQKDDGDDNNDRILLKPEQFRISASQRGHALVVADKGILRQIKGCSDKDAEVAEALAKVQDMGPPRLQKEFTDWNLEQGLLLFRGKVYIPKNIELRRDLVKIHHDSLAAGHPGRWKTLELLSRNYWWPGMSKFMNEYVSTCDSCNRTKTFPAKPQGPLKPNEAPEGPWQIITSDMIVELPKSDGFDSILITADRHTKQVHLTARHTTLDAKGAADLYIWDVFKLHGMPRKIITDRGPQFASKYLQCIYQGIRVKPAMSTAYHPQTDGQTERWNQEIEHYLRMFCNHRQDDWAKLLPIAEFALNVREHLATGQSPFKLLYGYNPEFTVSVNPMSQVPAANDRLKVLKEAQDDASAVLEVAAERMKVAYDRHVTHAPELKEGDKVWLDTKNLKIQRPSAKLSAKHVGPFKVK